MTAAAIGLHETYSVLSGAYNVLCGYHDTYSGPYFLSIARIDSIANAADDILARF